MVIIEGIHGLNGKRREGIPEEEKYKIYISPPTQLNVDEHNRVPTTDERLLRRMYQRLSVPRTAPRRFEYQSPEKMSTSSVQR